MRATADRRLAIRDFISDKRHTSIPEIMREFSISKSTVLRDLEALAETMSYYTTSGKGGGIHAMDGWYSSKRYLTDEQERFLERIRLGLNAEEDSIMLDSILLAFGRPKKRC